MSLIPCVCDCSNVINNMVEMSLVQSVSGGATFSMLPRLGGDLGMKSQLLIFGLFLLVSNTM